MFEEVARNPAIRSSRLRWLATADSPSAGWERGFYTKALFRLNEPQRREILRICSAGDETEVEAVIHELIAHELLWRLLLKPVWHPRVGKQTPDLAFRSGEQQFIGDCVVVHSPQRTVAERPDGTGSAYDGSEPGESRSHKVYVILEQKASKYRATGLPLAVFVFYGDMHLLDAEVVERALYGRTTAEAAEGETFPSVGYAPVLTGGLFLPAEDGLTRHPNLSAVVCCQWFWPHRSAPRQKRLSCTVCHHWAPETPLNLSAFAPVFQISWQAGHGGEWAPMYVGDPATVAGFEADGTLICRPYSNEAPW